MNKVFLLIREEWVEMLPTALRECNTLLIMRTYIGTEIRITEAVWKTMNDVIMPSFTVFWKTAHNENSREKHQHEIVSLVKSLALMAAIMCLRRRTIATNLSTVNRIKEKFICVV